MADFDVKAIAEQIIEKLKDSPEKLKELLLNNEKIKDFLGDDGKLSKDDFARIAEEIKKSAVVTSILGDDGKLGKDDLERVTDSAKGLLDKAKDMFSKK
ncbi:MAG: hypothetical protein K5637_07880 [Lachnospiraceae bacterium]|nr:hypothetical protein [Lachnospiraceae bacterium]